METDNNYEQIETSNLGFISALYHCETNLATNLCIYEIANKLEDENFTDIGGTYTNDEPDFWFYYTTSVCHGQNTLLNLFVLPRKAGSFTLYTLKSHQVSGVIRNTDAKTAVAFGPHEPLTFRTSKNDEHLFVKTFRFNPDDISALEKRLLLLPLKIEVHSTFQLDPNIVQKIKYQHLLKGSMQKKMDSADFKLVSCTNKEYPVHKVLIAAHSPVLREGLNNTTQQLAPGVSDEAMNIIIEFLYTGTIKNLYNQNCMFLLDIAELLQLGTLFKLTQHIMSEHINVNNAIDIAVTAKKYKLQDLSLKVFNFIKTHPETLLTESWNNLADPDLLKALLSFIHHPAIVAN